MNLRPAGRILRVSLAAGLTTYLLWRSDPSAVLEAAGRTQFSWLWIVVALVLVDRALMAYRWIVLLCVVEASTRPPVARLLQIFFVSTFVGSFLPASVGGDAVRAYSVSRERVSGADAVASVFMDRMLGVVSLLVMGIPGLLYTRGMASNAVVIAGLAGTVAACAATMLLVFNAGVGARFGHLLDLVPVAALRRLGPDIVLSIQRYARYRPQLLNVLASSVAVQILRVLQAYCLGRALGIPAALSTYFAFIPAILLIMLLPITINGLGTSQAAFVWFFAKAGVAQAAAFTLSVLFVGLQIIGNLPGALIYGWTAWTSQPAPAERRS